MFPRRRRKFEGVESLPPRFEKSVATKDGGIYLPFEEKAYFIAISDTPVLYSIFARPRRPRENSKIEF